LTVADLLKLEDTGALEIAGEEREEKRRWCRAGALASELPVSSHMYRGRGSRMGILDRY